MDTELARTFLAVVAAGSFVGAAERLHVTQSTVSARIRTLEERLRCVLFVRNKAGTRLTAAGRRFQKHAGTLVRTVEQARHDIGVPHGFRASLTVGGRFGLWERFLLRWLPAIRAAAPEVSLRAEVGFDGDLMQGLIEGRLDIGVMYSPQNRPGLIVELILEETLVLVSTHPSTAPEPDPGYIHVDWGPEFNEWQAATYAGSGAPAITANIGWLALSLVLARGGAGYFPIRLVSTHIDAGRLARVAGAPAFSLPAYAVYPRSSASEAAGPVVSALREMRRVAGAPRDEPG